jgi:hypothetical protein
MEAEREVLYVAVFVSARTIFLCFSFTLVAACSKQVMIERVGDNEWCQIVNYYECYDDECFELAPFAFRQEIRCDQNVVQIDRDRFFVARAISGCGGCFFLTMQGGDYFLGSIDLNLEFIIIGGIENISENLVRDVSCELKTPVEDEWPICEFVIEHGWSDNNGVIQFEVALNDHSLLRR